MSRKRARGRWGAVLVLVSAALLRGVEAGGQKEKGRRAAADEAARPAARTKVAFAGPELYKVDWRTPAIAAGDVNGDGRLDLLAVNPAKSRIECLLQRSPTEAQAERSARTAGGSEDVNELPDDRRFRSRPLVLEGRVFSLVSADLTGDGRDDLAYYGESKKLVIREQTPEGTWGREHTFDLPDGSRNPGALTAGDFDGDGLTDLALLGRKVLYLIVHTEDGEFAPVKKVPASAEATGFLLAADLNGDGRLDLAYPVAQQQRPLCFRLQDETGEVGPERFAEVPPFRAADSVHWAEGRRDYLAFILAASGRLEVRRLQAAETSGSAAEGPTLWLYPLEKDKVSRRFVLCDLNRDGRLDVVTTYPSTAQVGVFFQREAGGLAQPVLYPSFSAVSAMTAGDLDGDGHPELLVLSKEEDAVGYSRWEETSGGKGRLGFPQPVPVEGRPLALAAGDVNGDGRDEVLYVSKEEKTYRLGWRGLGETGEFSEEHAVELEGLDTDVSGLVASDLTGDGRLDVLVLVPFGPARLLVGDGEGDFAEPGAEAPLARSLLRRLSPEAVSVGDVNGDGRLELLLADKNYARALTVAQDGSPRVLEQANGKSARSEVASAAVADLDADGPAEVVLLDRWAKELTVLRRQPDGTLGEPRSIALPGLSLQEARVAAGEFTGDGRVDLVVLAQDGVGLVPTGGSREMFTLVAGYESDAEQARLGDLVAGDLFGDGRDELLALDVRNHNLELLRWEKGESLRRIYRFTVFEKKVFRGRPQGGSEPRQALLADLTGDGRTDIALLVHDRIALYPQVTPEGREETPGPGDEQERAAPLGGERPGAK